MGSVAAVVGSTGLEPSRSLVPRVAHIMGGESSVAKKKKGRGGMWLIKVDFFVTGLLRVFNIITFMGSLQKGVS